MGERRVVEILPCDIPAEIPILPLASTAVFPTTVVSLQVVREKNLNLIRNLAVDDIIGIVVQKKSTVDIPPPNELTEMGVAARLANRINLTPTTVQLILIGRSKSCVRSGKKFSARSTESFDTLEILGER